MQTVDKDKYDFWNDSTRFAEDPKHALAEVIRAMMPGYFYDRKKSLLISEAIKDTDFDLYGMGKWIWSDIQKRNLDLTKMDPKFTGPVLILHGRQDPLGESVPQTLLRYYEKSILVFVEKCGHYSWIEQPGKISENIKDFFEKNNSQN
jgi:proline iminopeptidase